MSALCDSDFPDDEDCGLSTDSDETDSSDSDFEGGEEDEDSDDANGDEEDSDEDDEEEGDDDDSGMPPPAKQQSQAKSEEGLRRGFFNTASKPAPAPNQGNAADGSAPSAAVALESKVVKEEPKKKKKTGVKKREAIINTEGHLELEVATDVKPFSYLNELALIEKEEMGEPDKPICTVCNTSLDYENPCYQFECIADHHLYMHATCYSETMRGQGFSKIKDFKKSGVCHPADCRKPLSKISHLQSDQLKNDIMTAHKKKFETKKKERLAAAKKQADLEAERLRANSDSGISTPSPDMRLEDLLDQPIQIGKKLRVPRKKPPKQPSVVWPAISEDPNAPLQELPRDSDPTAEKYNGGVFGEKDPAKSAARKQARREKREEQWKKQQLPMEFQSQRKKTAVPVESNGTSTGSMAEAVAMTMSASGDEFPQLGTDEDHRIERMLPKMRDMFNDFWSKRTVCISFGQEAVSNFIDEQKPSMDKQLREDWEFIKNRRHLRKLLEKSGAFKFDKDNVYKPGFTLDQVNKPFENLKLGQK